MLEMSDRLGLGSQVRELKIGQSFLQDASSVPSASFHTIRYDFKPASVDGAKEGKLSVAEDGRAVAVEVPNVDGNQVTNYRWEGRISLEVVEEGTWQKYVIG